MNYASLDEIYETNALQIKENQYDDIIKNTPTDHLLSETDAPYVTPAPHRGKRNEPSNVIYITRKIGSLKRLSEEEIAGRIMDNAKRMFTLP